MSVERRQRQQERESAGKPKLPSRKLITWVGVVVLCGAAYVAIWYRDTHHYDTFAKCLAARQTKMYGLYWCPHCVEQKQMFGRSFQYVPYVECGVPSLHDMTAECRAVGVKNFPSWQFQGGPFYEGELSLEDLSGRTGCSLP